MRTSLIHGSWATRSTLVVPHQIRGARVMRHPGAGVCVRGVLAVALLSFAPPRLAAQSSRVEGVVNDSLRGLPLAGAIVIATADRTLHDTVFHSALVNDQGHFSILGLRAGRYTLSVEHPFIDSVGVGARMVEVRVPDSGAVLAELGIPSAVTVRRAVCAVLPSDSTPGVMLGAVRRTDGTPVAGATIVFSWRDFDFDKRTASIHPRQLGASVKTDANGVYRACGLPLERPLFVQAQTTTDEQSGVLEELVSDVGILVRDFRVAQVIRTAEERAAIARDSALATRLFDVEGRVHQVGGRPLNNATVSLLGTGRSVTTASDGLFRFTGVSGGTQGVEVVALGYVPRHVRVEVDGGTKLVAVQMERFAVVLDSLRVIAKLTYHPERIGYREFDVRAAQGFGVFMNEEQIKAAHAVTNLDLYRMLRGVKVRLRADRPDSTVLVSTRGATSLVDGTQCVLDLYVDGMHVNPTDIMIVPPSELHGIEVHDVATMPPAYRSTSKCGGVFLWTRQ